jgi:hypothetical protein
MNIKAFLISVIALTLVIALPVTADISVEVRFGQDEISIIRDYYEDLGRKERKDKHAGRGLPPGIAKNLARGKALPPGIAKQELPPELVRRLPDAPDGHERIIVDGKVLLVDIATQVVRDILADVVF